MNMLVDTKKLAMHELLHLQFTLQQQKKPLMTLTQMHEHAEKLGKLLGDFSNVKSLSVDANALEIEYTLYSAPDSIERYSVTTAGRKFTHAIADDMVMNTVLIK